jgi:hypothetical protein
MGKLILTFGKYRGHDVNDILKKDPQYLDFIYYHAGCGGELKQWIVSHWKEIEEGMKTQENKH